MTVVLRSPLSSQCGPAGLMNRFDEFWEAYPRKVARKYAKACYQRADVSDEVLVDKAKEFAACVALWPPHAYRFIPHPSTWLNQGRWDDDPREWEWQEGDMEVSKWLR